MQQRFSALIPAAGLSTRMGTEKAVLMRPDGKTFAGHLIHCYRESGSDPVILVTNEQFDPEILQEPDFLHIINRCPELGRSHSIHLGLQRVPEGNSCFIHNVDNPFIDKYLIEKMISVVNDQGYVIPQANGKNGHPVLLGTKAVAYLRSLTSSFDLKKELQKFEKAGIESHHPGILLNINTPGDYQQFISESAV